MEESQDIIRIRTGLYRAVPIPGVRNENGQPVHMFIRIGNVVD